jgi:hypothetical protein
VTGVVKPPYSIVPKLRKSGAVSGQIVPGGTVFSEHWLRSSNFIFEKR